MRRGVLAAHGGIASEIFISAWLGRGFSVLKILVESDSCDFLSKLLDNVS
jgi:hypothetical protein